MIELRRGRVERLAPFSLHLPRVSSWQSAFDPFLPLGLGKPARPSATPRKIQVIEER